MVAGVAAGASALYPGGAPNAQLVDVRTADGNGESLTSDVIAGIDWILAHRAQYGIRVVNLSMVGNTQTSFLSDPLNKAVERLWFSGIVVVAAAGNNGTGTGEVDMSAAPGNDPFVITVGAIDQAQTSATGDDFVAPWSSYGHTVDGFAKPELSAPGRYLVMPVPPASTIATALPDRVVAPGYMWMSGTSFAAPVVSGAAAQLLARHPGWTPDQVKGALMLTARPPGQADGAGQPRNGRRLRGSRRLDGHEHGSHDRERRPRVEPRHLGHRLPARPHERRRAERGQSGRRCRRSRIWSPRTTRPPGGRPRLLWPRARSAG